MTEVQNDPAPSPKAPAEDALPVARFKSKPEDFVVEELPAYEPSGAGDHLYVTFRKRALTTPDAVRVLARALNVDARDAGWAGLKDKLAVTTQTVSLPAPREAGSVEERLRRAAEVVAAEGAGASIEVLAISRHTNKLKPGHLRGNRFRIVLRGLDATGADRVCAGLERATREGVPNYFGEQRYGVGGGVEPLPGNVRRALGFVSGGDRPPKDKRQVRFLFSALQSHLFDEVLARRVAEETWATVLVGDLAKKHDTGGLFLVAEADLADAVTRARERTLSATGPMFGASMRTPTGEPERIEREILAASGLDETHLARFRHAGEGTRRALRVMVDEVHTEVQTGSVPSEVELILRFALPKGAYATTLLHAVAHLSTSRARDTPAVAEGDEHGYAPEEPAD
ncbi:MAG: tRNA pseudouridine(13) synthase TruD [Polyangiaceae bacterium]